MAAVERAAQSGGLEIVETEDGELIAVDKDGSFYSTKDSTDFVGNKPSKEKIDKLVGQIQKAEEIRLKKRRERSGKEEDGDVTYINDKNKQVSQAAMRLRWISMLTKHDNSSIKNWRGSTTNIHRRSGTALKEVLLFEQFRTRSLALMPLFYIMDEDTKMRVDSEAYVVSDRSQNGELDSLAKAQGRHKHAISSQRMFFPFSSLSLQFHSRYALHGREGFSFSMKCFSFCSNTCSKHSSACKGLL